MSSDYREWHGHVRPRPDGIRARCGGPGLCPHCQVEQGDLTKSHVRGEVWVKPTEAQASAGNYRKPTIKWNGLDIAVENPVGSIRSGKGWQTKMLYDYGYIKRSEAVDGDEVDVYLGPQLSAPTVFIVHQRKAGDWDAYDEDKCMIGFDDEADARAAYLQHYSDHRFLGPITAMSVDEFVRKVKATNDAPAMIKGMTMSRIILFTKSHNDGNPPPPGRVVDENGKPEIVEDLDGLISEHEHLVGVLDEADTGAAHAEAKSEGEELKEFKQKRALFVKSDELSETMRKKIGTVGSAHRDDMPADAFLLGAERKYPVKVKGADGKWAYSAKLLSAAAARARMEGRDDLAKRADEISLKL